MESQFGLASLPGAQKSTETDQENAQQSQNPSVGAGQNEREQQSGNLESEEQTKTGCEDRGNKNERTTGRSHGSSRKNDPVASIAP